MNTEISHLKGGKFHISMFVGVALVTMIRETMIATLKHEKPESRLLPHCGHPRHRFRILDRDQGRGKIKIVAINFPISLHR